jgi:hypothetical protein
MLGFAEHGDLEAALARHFIADTGWDLAAKVLGRETEWGVDTALLDPARPFIEEHRASGAIEALGDPVLAPGGGPTHLADDFRLVGDIFVGSPRTRSARRRTRAPRQQRCPRRDHLGPDRARQLRPVRPGGVRRILTRW